MTNDPFLDKGLPSNLACERIVLGAILLDNVVLTEATKLLKSSDFFLVSSRLIYDVMLYLNGKDIPIELVTVSERLRDLGLYEQVGGATYIASLIDGVPRTDTIEHYARMIKEKAFRRQVILECNKLIAQSFEEEDDHEEFVTTIQQRFLRLLEEQVSGGFQIAGELAQVVLEKVEAIQGRGELLTGIPTGFTDLDVLLNGLQRKNLIVIGARPSQGKTALALNIAQYAAKSGFTVGIFSLEMAAEQLCQRMLSAEARVDSQRLRRGVLNREEWARLADALRRITDQKIFIDDSTPLSAFEIRARTAQLKAQYGVDLILVDYLGYVKADSKEGKYTNRSRAQEIGDTTRALKGIAKALNIPVVLLCQLNRRSEDRSDSRPKMSDLRDSGEIEQDADEVIFIYREEVYKPTDENRGLAELIVEKQRNGPTGDLQLAFLKEFTRFENMWRE